MTSFESLGLTRSILITLQQIGFTDPTPIQREAIPSLLEGRDLMGLAQTGTGKTGAFGLPIIDRLLREPTVAGPGEVRALILAPTRELASQIAESLRSFSKRSPLKIVTVVGGLSLGAQAQKLAKGSDILIATPGRLIDHMKRGSVRLGGVKYLVFDEADQMLDLGFIQPLRQIARSVPAKRQTMLFSATMPKAIADLSREFLTDPVRVEVTPPGKAADKVDQMVYFAEKAEKGPLLRALLKAAPDSLSLVFARTKHGADKLNRELERGGFKSAAIHGNKSQNNRDRTLAAFRAGEIRVLVATDVAARGIDIPGVTHVFNFDLPNVPEIYVHRIGRTARAGASGIAITLCAGDERKLLRDVERLLKMDVPVADRTGLVIDRKPLAPLPGEAQLDRSEAERPTRSQRPQRLRSNGPSSKPGGSRGPGGRDGSKRPTANQNSGRSIDERRTGDRYAADRIVAERPAGERKSGEPIHGLPGAGRPAHAAPNAANDDRKPQGRKRRRPFRGPKRAQRPAA